MKDEFLASMSHELRTPLNGILALSQSLLEEVYGPMNERQAGSLRDIEQCGKHLLSLITDVLDFSKIEAKKFELANILINLPSFLNNSVAMFRYLAEEKRLFLSLKIDDDLPS